MTTQNATPTLTIRTPSQQEAWNNYQESLNSQAKQGILPASIKQQIIDEGYREALKATNVKGEKTTR